jgi:hypothetical protein
MAEWSNNGSHPAKAVGTTSIVKIASRSMRLRGVFRSVDDLKAAINHFVTETNAPGSFESLA